MKIRNGHVSNSSTSSFICETDMSAEEVREKLERMIEFHNDFNDESLNFCKVFSEPFIADDEYCNSDWADHYSAIKEANGKVIIQGAFDNSVPYEMWEYIERKFDAERCHFG